MEWLRRIRNSRSSRRLWKKTVVLVGFVAALITIVGTIYSWRQPEDKPLFRGFGKFDPPTASSIEKNLLPRDYIDLNQFLNYGSEEDLTFLSKKTDDRVTWAYLHLTRADYLWLRCKELGKGLEDVDAALEAAAENRIVVTYSIIYYQAYKEKLELVPPPYPTEVENEIHRAAKKIEQLRNSLLRLTGSQYVHLDRMISLGLYRTPANGPGPGAIKILPLTNESSGWWSSECVGKDGDIKFSAPLNIFNKDCLVSYGRALLPPKVDNYVSLRSGQINLKLLSIGINNYQDFSKLGDLGYAVSDASNVASVFDNIGFDTKLLLNRDANRFNIISELTYEVLGSHENDVLYVYVAAHGISDIDGTPFIVVPSESSEGVDLIPLAVIKNILADYRGKAYAVIDTCFNSVPLRIYSHVDSEGGGWNRSNKVSNILLASSIGERAIESPYLKSGIATYYFIKYIESNSDEIRMGKINFEDMISYVGKSTSETALSRYGLRQNPVALNFEKMPNPVPRVSLRNNKNDCLVWFDGDLLAKNIVR